MPTSPRKVQKLHTSKRTHDVEASPAAFKILVPNAPRHIFLGFHIKWRRWTATICLNFKFHADLVMANTDAFAYRSISYILKMRGVK